MKITDRIYGEVNITEPVLVELMQAPTVLRLKGISQMGVPAEFRSNRGLSPDFSRYEHSVGVMLLLRRYGASLEEQVAGLLHDVSHLAFSHLYDWVAYDHDQPHPSEDMQDLRHEEYIAASELPGILERHGLDLHRVSDHTSFSLLDREKPDLCADRIDYALRQMTEEVIQSTLAGLAVDDGQFVFTEIGPALKFAKEFLRLQDEDWASRDMVLLYTYFAQILRWALEAGVITDEDFNRDDLHIWKKLQGTEVEPIQRGMALLRRRHLPEAKGRGKKIYKKFRYVDPPVKTGQGFKRASALDKDFKEYIKQAARRNGQGMVVEDLVKVL